MYICTGYSITVEIDEDAAIADAAGGVVEVGHAKWVLHYRAAARKVAGVNAPPER